MTHIGMSEFEQDTILKMVSSVLNLGQLHFHTFINDQSKECTRIHPDSNIYAMYISQLLEIPMEELEKCYPSYLPSCVWVDLLVEEICFK